VNDGGGNGGSCGGIKVRTDTTIQRSCLIIASFRGGRNVVAEGKMFIKDEARVASKVGDVK